MKVPPLDLPLAEIRAELQKLRHPLHIAIIRAKNPFNVGAVIRVAHSFLVREIVLVGDAPFYERASMGMERYENIVKVPDDAALVAHAKAAGLPIVVLEKDHATANLFTAPFPERCLMVFGSEDFGVGDDLVKAADLVLGIPMYGINHSFPLAIAAGIAMAEWTRRFARGTPESGE